MRWALALMLVAVLLIFGCSKSQSISGAQCASDSDCATGGCSNELCGAKGEVENVTTACVYLQTYQCLKLTSCGCINGLCQWQKSDKFNKCIEANK